jgi:hypothetical protein
MEGWSVNFQKWKGIWIYNRSLNQFSFEKKTTEEEVDCDERQKWRRWKSWKEDPLCVVRIFLILIFLKIPNVNIILSHVNHTFLYWTFKLEPKPLDTRCTIEKNVFLKMWRRVQFDSNRSLDFWSLDPCLKWLLVTYNHCMFVVEWLYAVRPSF